MKPEEIYNLLVARNMDEPENPTNCYIDYETNTIWALAGDGKLMSFWSPDHMFKHMSDEEIDAFLIECLKPKK